MFYRLLVIDADNLAKQEKDKCVHWLFNASSLLVCIARLSRVASLMDHYVLFGQDDWQTVEDDYATQSAAGNIYSARKAIIISIKQHF